MEVNVEAGKEGSGAARRRVIVTGASGFIGKHMVERLQIEGYQVVILDVVPPKEEHRALWCEASIMDAAVLERVFAKVQPRYVIHLAAYASMEAKSLDEFRVNTEGTRILLEAIKQCSSVERVIVTSSQHVRRPGTPPAKSDQDYVPHAFYGESKVITEQNTRAAGLKCCWTIVRPTTVWGPFQPPMADGVWKVLKKGLYLHPANDPVMRSYGYVKNVVWQMERLLQAPVEKVNGRVFYVGDCNMRQYDWINDFARALTGKDVKTVPLGVIRGLSLLGDGLRSVGLRFPIYRSRFYNLISPNPVPIEPTLELLGTPPYTMEQGIGETIKWLESYYRLAGKG
ncbi:MAG: NAD(P)-dependent oxidoreductase [Verrucomicrobia bacterium]|nr:NAD(P)-dependent oxidoreductase [Verrucomicrobiota bacterium]